MGAQDDCILEDDEMANPLAPAPGVSPNSPPQQCVSDYAHREDMKDVLRRQCTKLLYQQSLGRAFPRRSLAAPRGIRGRHGSSSVPCNAHSKPSYIGVVVEERLFLGVGRVERIPQPRVAARFTVVSAQQAVGRYLGVLVARSGGPAPSDFDRHENVAPQSYHNAKRVCKLMYITLLLSDRSYTLSLFSDTTKCQYCAEI